MCINKAKHNANRRVLIVVVVAVVVVVTVIDAIHSVFILRLILESYILCYASDTNIVAHMHPKQEQNN